MLDDHGYVQHAIRLTATTSTPYYYMLEMKGVSYLAAAGIDISVNNVTYQADKFPLFLDCTLELNELIIAAALLSRCAQQYYLHYFIHERILK